MQTIGLDHGARRVTGVLVSREPDADPGEVEVLATATRPAGAGAVAAVVAELAGGGNPDLLSHVVLASDLVADQLAARRMRPVGAIRLCDPARSVMPPYHGWPTELAGPLGAPGVLSTAGDVDRAVTELASRGMTAIAITGAFSGVSAGEERRASAAVRARIPGARVTLSHSLGPIGLLDRENTAILNASTVDGVTATLTAWADDLAGRGSPRDLPLHLVRHDGTVGDSDYLQEHPLLTVGGRRAALARGCAVAAGCPQVLVGWPAADGWGMEVVAVREHLPQRSDRPRVVLGVPTSLPQSDVRHAAAVQRWDRIAGDDRVLVREATAIAGVDDPLVVVDGERVRALSGGAPGPGGGRRRPRLRVDDPAVLTALGAATGPVGGECERLIVPGRDEGRAAAEVEAEARVRAVAAGARFASTQVVARSSARVSYTAGGGGGQWQRVVVRVVGEPAGRRRGARP